MSFNFKILNILILVICAVILAFLWYTPILFKGYHPDVINDQIVLARNLAESGKFSLYDDHGVIISSDLVNERGEISSIGNKFTAYFYAEVFKKFGVLPLYKIVLTSVILNAASLLILSFTVFRLFDIKTAAVFSFVFGLFPFYWRSIYFLGNYEFAFLFVSLFFLFFTLGKNKNLESVYFIFAGIFLSAAVLAKEAFLLMLPIIFFYLILEKKEGNNKIIWKKNIKSAVFLFAPVVIILSIFYLPNFLKGGNIYRSQLFSEAPKNKFDFSLAGHLFPDYYTFRFDRENFLKQAGNKDGFLEEAYFKKAESNVGEKKGGFFERFFVGSTLLIGHLARFTSLEELGGPIVLALIILGFSYLRQKNRFLFRFFIFWILGTVFILSFIVFAGRDHLMDFSFALAVLCALGIIYLSDIISGYFKLSSIKSNILFLFIFIVLIYNLFLTDHIVWGKAYDGNMPRLIAYAEKLKKENINQGDTVAAGLRQDENLTLNYLSNRSLIVFRTETFRKILDSGKEKEVFKEFNIKYILGYDDDLSREIVEKTGVKNIVLENKNFNFPKTSFLKMWLLGIVR